MSEKLAPSAKTVQHMLSHQMKDPSVNAGEAKPRPWKLHSGAQANSYSKAWRYLWNLESTFRVHLLRIQLYIDLTEIRPLQSPCRVTESYDCQSGCRRRISENPEPLPSFDVLDFVPL